MQHTSPSNQRAAPRGQAIRTLIDRWRNGPPLSRGARSGTAELLWWLQQPEADAEAECATGAAHASGSAPVSTSESMSNGGGGEGGSLFNANDARQARRGQQALATEPLPSRTAPPELTEPSSDNARIRRSDATEALAEPDAAGSSIQSPATSLSGSVHSGITVSPSPVGVGRQGSFAGEGDRSSSSFETAAGSLSRQVSTLTLASSSSTNSTKSDAPAADASLAVQPLQQHAPVWTSANASIAETAAAISAALDVSLSVCLRRLAAVSGDSSILDELTPRSSISSRRAAAQYSSHMVNGSNEVTDTPADGGAAVSRVHGSAGSPRPRHSAAAAAALGLRELTGVFECSSESRDDDTEGDARHPLPAVLLQRLQQGGASLESRSPTMQQQYQPPSAQRENFDFASTRQNNDAADAGGGRDDDGAASLSPSNGANTTTQSINHSNGTDGDRTDYYYDPARNSHDAAAAAGVGAVTTSASFGSLEEFRHLPPPPPRSYDNRDRNVNGNADAHRQRRRLSSASLQLRPLVVAALCEGGTGPIVLNVMQQQQQQQQHSFPGSRENSSSAFPFAGKLTHWLPSPSWQNQQHPHLQKQQQQLLALLPPVPLSSPQRHPRPHGSPIAVTGDADAPVTISTAAYPRNGGGGRHFLAEAEEEEVEEGHGVEEQQQPQYRAIVATESSFVVGGPGVVAADGSMSPSPRRYSGPPVDTAAAAALMRGTGGLQSGGFPSVPGGDGGGPEMWSGAHRRDPPSQTLGIGHNHDFYQYPAAAAAAAATAVSRFRFQNGFIPASEGTRADAADAAEAESRPILLPRAVHPPAATSSSSAMVEGDGAGGGDDRANFNFSSSERRGDGADIETAWLQPQPFFDDEGAPSVDHEMDGRADEEDDDGGGDGLGALGSTFGRDFGGGGGSGNRAALALFALQRARAARGVTPSPAQLREDLHLAFELGRTTRPQSYTIDAQSVGVISHSLGNPSSSAIGRTHPHLSQSLEQGTGAAYTAQGTAAGAYANFNLSSTRGGAAGGGGAHANFNLSSRGGDDASAVTAAADRTRLSLTLQPPGELSLATQRLIDANRLRSSSSGDVGDATDGQQQRTAEEAAYSIIHHAAALQQQQQWPNRDFDDATLHKMRHPSGPHLQHVDWESRRRPTDDFAYVWLARLSEPAPVATATVVPASVSSFVPLTTIRRLPIDQLTSSSSSFAQRPPEAVSDAHLNFRRSGPVPQSVSAATAADTGSVVFGVETTAPPAESGFRSSTLNAGGRRKLSRSGVASAPVSVAVAVARAREALTRTSALMSSLS